MRSIVVGHEFIWKVQKRRREFEYLSGQSPSILCVGKQLNESKQKQMNIHNNIQQTYTHYLHDIPNWMKKKKLTKKKTASPANAICQEIVVPKQPDRQRNRKMWCCCCCSRFPVHYLRSHLFFFLNICFFFNFREDTKPKRYIFAMCGGTNWTTFGEQ